MQPEHRKSFHKYYQEKILPEIHRLERLRQAQNIKHKIAQIVLAFSIILFVPSYFYVQSSSLDEHSIVTWAYGIIIAIFIFIGPFYYLEPKNFTSKINSNLIKSFLDFFGGFIHLTKKGPDKKVLAHSMLFEDFKKIHYRHCFKKNYLGMDVQISELDLENKDKEDIFSGIVVELQLTKNFFSQTIITEHKFSQSGFVSNVLKNMPKSTIQDTGLAALFDLYTKSEGEGKMVARNAVLNQLSQLKSAYKSHDIRAYFGQNSVIIAIPSIRESLTFGELQTTISDNGKLEKLFAEFIEVLITADALRG